MTEQNGLTPSESNLDNENTKLILSSRKSLIWLSIASVVLFLSLSLYVADIYGFELLPGSEFDSPNVEQEYTSNE